MGFGSPKNYSAKKHKRIAVLRRAVTMALKKGDTPTLKKKQAQLTKLLKG